MYISICYSLQLVLQIAINCVLRWFSSSMGITAGIHRVCSALPKCRSFTSSTQKFSRDTEHSSHWRFQSVEQWVDEVVRRAEGSVWPSGYYNHGRAGACGRNKRRGEWVCRRGGPVVACVACLEKHRHVGDKSCRVVVGESELCSIASISHCTCLDISGTFYTHSLPVCCCGTPTSVCRTAASIVRPCRSFFSSILRGTRQQ